MKEIIDFVSLLPLEMIVISDKILPYVAIPLLLISVYAALTSHKEEIKP